MDSDGDYSPLPASEREKINSSKVLVVGAGGIGCELIKNLVLSGYKNIEIIDLDTIDVSNLNRQLLFQKHHVGKSKAKVAHEKAESLRTDMNITSHHASIFNPEFNVEFFRRFNVILNALDNRAARNHVNRLSLAAGIPLVESGSAGYLGQVNVIMKGKTECYECYPKPRQKTFPGCTIRNTPSELIHCVVWAKYLFNQLFGEEDADQDVSPDTADPEAAMSSVGDQSQIVSTRSWAKEKDYNCEKVFNKLFNGDIRYLLSMEKLWTKRRRPIPAEWKSEEYTDKYPTSSQEIMSHEQNIALFNRSLTDLKNCFKKGNEDMLVWDKDDECAMVFVAAAANIRAKIFGIDEKSIFEIKSMAGNIIPAIATTNAMVAGIMVLQAMSILQGEFSRCRNVYVSRVPNPNKKLIAPIQLDPPLPTCYVCAEKPEVTVQMNIESFTLNDLKEKILKSHFGMLAPDVEVEGTGTIILSSEEGETDENLPKKLSTLNVRHSTRLRVDDFLQNFNLILNIHHVIDLPEDIEFQVRGYSYPIFMHRPKR